MNAQHFVDAADCDNFVGELPNGDFAKIITVPGYRLIIGTDVDVVPKEYADLDNALYRMWRQLNG